jgi:hypothetical protein
MVVVLGLVVVLSTVVGAMAVAGTTAARLRINAWNRGQARLAAEAGIQRMVFEARRVMVDQDPGNQPNYPTVGEANYGDVGTLRSLLTGALASIPDEDNMTKGVSLGDGQTYTIPSIHGGQVTVVQDSTNTDLVDVTMSFSSIGTYNRASVTLNATVVLQANRWLLPNDTVMVKSLSYQ